MADKLSSKRYEPPPINLKNKNSSQTLAVELTGSNNLILEVGTSTGYLTKILRDMGNRVIGVEIDEEAARIAEEYCDLMIIGDIEVIDLDEYLGPPSIDVAILGDVLEHLNNPGAVLEKIKRYLKPQGSIVVSIPNVCHGDVILHLLKGDFRYTSVGLLDQTHLRFFGFKNVVELLNGCGYFITDVLTTRIHMGDTELGRDLEEVPRELFKFIESLPNADVYQFVLSAKPSKNPKNEPIPEVDLKMIFDRMVEDLLNEHETSLKREINEICAKQQEALERIRALDQELLERDGRVNEVDRELQTAVAQIQELKQALSVRDERVSELKDQFSQSEDQVQRLEKEIFEMRRSIVWQLLMKYHNGLVERRMPLGTKRRKCYDLGLESGRILLNEGLKSLSFRARVKLSSKIPFLKENLNAPLFETNRLGWSSCVPFLLDEGLSGEFVFPAEGLNEVRIFTATCRRRNADLTLRLKASPKGPVIREAKVKGQAVKDNDYTSFRFKAIREIPEETVFFELESEGEPHAAVWYDPAAKSRELRLYRSGRETKGEIGIQAFSSLKLRDRYHLWRLKNEPSQRELEVLKKNALSLKYRPKISIITPVWNTEERWLRRAIESVLSQVYDNWELCIAEGRSEGPHVREVLEEYEAANPRILVKFLPENRGIAGNSNEALSMATGDFVAFLDHDDELAPFALYEVVKLLNENPNLDYVYSDEDKIDETGARHDPFFKPDWSPDMFLSCNYLCHLSVIRKRLVDEVGGFRSEYDGSQDYDLFLRVTERIGDDGIGHIPKILYHWRTVPESTASSHEAKSYAYQGAIKSLEDAMMRREIGIENISMGICLGVDYRITYKIIDEPKISIIIPTRDNVNTLRKCVNSIIAKTLYDNYEIILIDNQSVKEETFNYYKTLDGSFIKILQFDEVFNYSKLNNFAVSNSSSEFLVFLNNDVEIISERWIVAMLEHAQTRTVGAVGAKLLYPNGSIQHAGVIIGLGGVAGHAHKCFPANNPGYFCRIQMVQNFSAVTAACMMTKKSLFEEVGGFDEKNLAIAFNDIDYCLKLRQKGYRIVYTPYAELYHHESLSRGYEDTPEKQKRFQEEVSFMRKKWGDLLDKDPYYNPNLTRDSEDFSIRIRHNLSFMKDRQ